MERLERLADPPTSSLLAGCTTPVKGMVGPAVAVADNVVNAADVVHEFWIGFDLKALEPLEEVGDIPVMELQIAPDDFLIFRCRFLVPGQFVNECDQARFHCRQPFFEIFR